MHCPWSSKLCCLQSTTLTCSWHRRIDPLGPWNGSRVHLRRTNLSRSRHHTTSLGPWSSSRIHLRGSNLPWSGRHRSTPLGPWSPRRAYLRRRWPRCYLWSWNSSSGRTIQRRLHYLRRELTPALRHGDQEQRVEELRPAKEPGLVLIGVHPYLRASENF